MTVTTMELKVHDIVDDPDMTAERKVAKLETLQNDARAIQRAASESPMVDDDGWHSDLRVVEKALEKLGAGKSQTGAATL